MATMQTDLPRRRRPRPVPDAPVEYLLERSSDLAGGWLVALVESLALEDTPRIHLGELAVEGPALCEAVVRALSDDDALGRLRDGGTGERLAARAGQIAGAGGPEAISAAVDCLCGVIWEALRRGFDDPSPDQLFALGERLSLVGELVRGAGLRAWSGRGELSVSRRESPPAEARETPPSEDVDPGGWEPRLAEWVAGAKERSSALALLLVELDDADRLLAISSPEEAATVFDSFDTALRATAGDKAEVLIDGGRAWVIAPGLSRARAWGLGARLSSAVSAAPRWRGAPLKVSLGLAVLGQNGDDAPSLIAAAEEARYAAQASGLGPAG